MMFPTDLAPVILESPFKGGRVQAGPRQIYLSETTNIEYMRACMHDCIVNHYEAPYASHGLYTQPGVLRDSIEEERNLGIGAGFVWATLAPTRVFYVDRGMSEGMIHGLRHALELTQKVEFRRLRGAWDLGYELDLDPDLATKLNLESVSVKSL